MTHRAASLEHLAQGTRWSPRSGHLGTVIPMPPTSTYPSAVSDSLPPRPSPPAAMVAEAFDVGRPVEPLTHHRWVGQEAWTFSTMTGRFLVVRLWAGPDPAWRAQVEEAMDLERRAQEAGVAMLTPVEPQEPAFGFAARVHGFGVFRVYEWVDHRPLDREDDVAEWLGTTLALLHRLRPLDTTPQPQGYGLYPPAHWHAWLAEGEAQGRSWASPLRDHLAGILRASTQVAEAFSAGKPHVVTHRAVEPSRVVMTDGGPLLLGWDAVGPDSAPLEAAHAIVEFATVGWTEPDADRVHRASRAYATAGGATLRPGPAALARWVGRRLEWLGACLDVTLGLRHPVPAELADMDQARLDAHVREEVETFPALVDTMARWSALVGDSSGSTD